LSENLLIKLENLQLKFAASEGLKNLVRRSELELPAKSSIGIVGESGSGKTLTVSAILGVVPILPGITGGGLWLNYYGENKNIWADLPDDDGYNRRKYFSWQKKLTSRMKKYRGKKISIIFQKAKASLNPFLKIKSQIYESLKLAGEQPTSENMLIWLYNCGFDKNEARLVANQYPHQLSGGQAQRAIMAITLSTQAETIIADEPTTGLDAKLQVETLVFMKKMLDKFERSAIIVSHNLYSISKFTEICYVMYRGLTVEKGPTEKILQKGGKNHPYTQKLREGVESQSEIGQIVSAEIPGCPFHPNCHLYKKFDSAGQKRCREEEPLKTTIDSDHYLRCWAFV
jgi:oligopeptide transport system ATP-binding protein